MISKPPEREKLSKDQALYVFKPEAKGRYQCDQCWMWQPTTERCSAHGKNDRILGTASCGYWMWGKPGTGPSPQGSLTKLESGYTENPNGEPFGCHRCEEFDGKSKCEIVSGYIQAMGCCSAWKPIDQPEWEDDED